MRRILLKTLNFLLILGVVFFVSGADFSLAKNKNSAKPPEPSGQAKKNKEEFVPGEILVKFKQNIHPNREKSLENLNQELGPEPWQQVIKGKAAQKLNIYKKKVPQGKEREAIVKLSRHPKVEYAELNGIVEISLIPNDPYYSSSGSWGQTYPDLWGIHKISAELAWDTTTGAEQVVVAVIDTGVDYNHEDLAQNMATNPGETGNGKETNGLDDDQNGYVDDWRGWDFVNNDNDPMDDHGHGSHVSGTIAGVGNNGLGVVGVSWKTKIYPIKFLSAGGWGTWEGAVASLTYGADLGIKISSNSWGGGYSQITNDAVRYAYEKGQTVVVAAGNSAWDALYYSPASSANAVTVGATDPDDNLAWFSNIGPKIDVTAPGVDTLSVRAANTSMGYVLNDKYTRASGTSMATPHVAGLASLVLALHPEYTPEQVKSVLSLGADDLGNPGFDNTFGYGRINAAKTLQTTPADLMPPRILWPQDGGAFGIATQIKGMGVSGGQITLYLDGQNVATATAGADNLWFTSLPGSVTEGSHTLYAIQTKDTITSGQGPMITVTVDITVPTISNLALVTLTDKEAMVSWTTDEPATTEATISPDAFGYGLTYGYTTDHQFRFYDLIPSTTYTYRVQSKDPSGNIASSPDQTFTTLPDTFPPKVLYQGIYNVSSTSLKIEIYADEKTYATVEYGLDTSYGQTASDGLLTSWHIIGLTNLTPATTYHWHARLVDQANNVTETPDSTFTTTPPPPVFTETLEPNQFEELGSGLGMIGEDIYQWVDFPAGFYFPFYHQTYTKARVSNKGYLTLGNNTCSIWYNSDLWLKRCRMIAPAWSDFRTDGSAQPNEDVYMYQPDPDHLTFRWKAETWQGAHPINVAVTLSALGHITFSYGSGNDNSGNDVSNGFTVGLSAGNETDYFFSSHNTKMVLDRAETAKIVDQDVVGVLFINDGVENTNNRDVQLRIITVDDSQFTAVRFSNDEQNWTEEPTLVKEKPWTLSGGDGIKTVFAQLKKLDGTWTNSFSDSILLDTNGPTGTLAIYGGAEFTNSYYVNLNLAFSDISGLTKMKFSNDSTNWSQEETYSPTRYSWEIEHNSEGRKTVYVQVSDSLGNWGSALDTIIYDRTPPTGKAIINNGANYTSSRNVVVDLLDLTDNLSGVANTMNVYNDWQFQNNWQNLQTHFDWTLSEGDGSKSVTVVIKDGAGNWGYLYDTIQLDTTAPIISLSVSPTSIMKGAVSINLTVKEYLYPAYQASVLQTGQVNPTMVTLGYKSSSGGEYLYQGSYAVDPTLLGTANVSTTVTDYAGNSSSASTTFLVYDDVAPTGSILINNGAVRTKYQTVTLKLSASDNASGVVLMRLSNNGVNWNAWEPYLTSKSWQLSPGRGTKTVYVQYQDRVGNISQTYSDSIYLQK